MKLRLLYLIIIFFSSPGGFSALAADVPDENIVLDNPEASTETQTSPENISEVVLTPTSDEDRQPLADFSLPDNLYIVQPGDMLNINVWGEDTLQSITTVLPDGTISFALIGYMNVAGKTLPQIRDGVVDRLSKFLPDPVVTVGLSQLAGNLIYVIGNVARPGSFAANRNLDVMQVLSLAGGMTSFAAVNKVKILRRINGVEKVIRFSYRDVEKGKNLEQNILLQSGDVIVVP